MVPERSQDEGKGCIFVTHEFCAATRGTGLCSPQRKGIGMIHS